MRGGARVGAAIVLVALAIRVAVVLATSSYVPINDAADYDRLAVSLVEEQEFGESRFAAGGGPTALRPPLYPMALAAVYAVGGHRVQVARLAQTVLGTLVVVLVGLLALVIWDRRTALLALAAAAVCPSLVLADTALGSETLFTSLVLVATLAAVLQRRRADGIRGPLLAGALGGLATLTRPVGLLVVVALVVLIGRRPGAVPAPRRSSLRPAALVLAGAFFVVAPWTVRNALVLQRFVPLTTQTGFHLAGTYNETARHDDEHPAAWRPANLDPAYARLLAADPDADEVTTERRLRSAVLDHMREHPLYPLEVIGWNLVRTAQLDGWTWNRQLVAGEFGHGHLLADISLYGSWALLALGALGAATVAARRAPWAVWLVPGLLVVGNLPIRSSLRYRVPADPFLVVLAALALSTLWSRRRRADAMSPRQFPLSSPGPTDWLGRTSGSV